MCNQVIALLSLTLLLASCGAKPSADGDRPFDLLITNARVVDGMGNPWYRADVAVRDGAIVEIGRLEGRAAARTIDAAGRVLSPGFIDMMGGRTYPLLEDPDAAESKLRQGITTMLAGEGTSEAPQTEKTIADMPLAARLGISWSTYAEYDQLLEKMGLRLNVIHTVGAGQVRQIVMGEQDGRPTPEQMIEMKSLVRKAMEDGAAGLSTALIYPPGTYATTSEIAELAKETAPYGGVYFTHMRNESGKVLEAIQEAIDIGKQAGVPVHIFHLKAAGQENWPLMAQSINLIETTRAQGFDVTADVYPYIRNGIGLGSFLHPRHYAEGSDKFIATLSDPEVRRAVRREAETTSDWENWYRHVGMNWDNVLVAQVSGSLDKGYEGKSVAQIAAIRNSDEWTAFFDLVAAGGVSVNPKSMNEEQKHLALRAEFVSVDTDASPMNAGNVSSAHPRAFGAFPRILAKYVRDEKVISLEKAVRKMTSLPANRLGLRDRGRITPGMKADLLIFDPEKVQDNATFEKPVAYASGFDYVIVNGQLVIDDNAPTQSRPGRVVGRR
ncbi:MAG: D-aminoacylase [Acidobacteria bacterium]|nr:D-aminoacylase [Acidobacteriota bacterium]